MVLHDDLARLHTGHDLTNMALVKHMMLNLLNLLNLLKQPKAHCRPENRRKRAG